MAAKKEMEDGALLIEGLIDLQELHSLILLDAVPWRRVLLWNGGEG